MECRVQVGRQGNRLWLFETCLFLKLILFFPPLTNLRLLPPAAWAKAVAALMIIGLLVLIVAFIVSCVALCCSLNIPLLPFVGVLLIVVGEETSCEKKLQKNENQKKPG